MTMTRVNSRVNSIRTTSRVPLDGDAVVAMFTMLKRVGRIINPSAIPTVWPTHSSHYGYHSDAIGLFDGILQSQCTKPDQFPLVNLRELSFRTRSRFKNTIWLDWGLLITQITILRIERSCSILEHHFQDRNHIRAQHFIVHRQPHYS